MSKDICQCVGAQRVKWRLGSTRVGKGGEDGRTPLEMDTGEGEKRQGIERIPGNAHREHPAGWELADVACRGKEHVP